MPTVAIDAADAPDRALHAEAPAGTRLLDLCDERDAPVPFSCRDASCGTCRVDVLEGRELLEPPNPEELAVLGVFGDDPSRRRLACQLRVARGSGRIHVRSVPR
jgi:ferredoxin